MTNNKLETNKSFFKKLNDDNFSGFLSFFDGEEVINWLYSSKLLKFEKIPEKYDDPHDFRTNYLYWYNSLRNFLKKEKNSLSIDIGAFSGDSTIPIAKLSNKTLAFECHPENFIQLQANCKINTGMDIDCYNFAIAPKDGFIRIGYPPERPCDTGPNGGAVIFNHYSDFIVQKCINLENFLNDKYKDYKVNFIKIDTEGLDMFIIGSIINLIKKDRPILHLEVFPFFEEFAKFIKENNYYAYYGDSFKEVDLNDIKIGDFICLPQKIESYF